MPISRRKFLKISAAASLTTLLLDKVAHAKGQLRDSTRKLEAGDQTFTICPYCSVGCGIVLRTDGNLIVNAEGDPTHPINEGALCSKGGALANLRQIYLEEGKPVLNPRRLTKVLYRAPGAEQWVEKSWDWALPEIAKRIKATRDATFETKDQAGVTVNRTRAIAHLGSAALDNEECYALVKFQRALGLQSIDHEARL